jgi:cobalt-zinc-cadmium efflux system protein
MNHHDHSGHGHSHNHGDAAHNRGRIALTLGLTTLYLVAEVVGGLLTNSLALLADAAHMLSDVAALALTFFAIWIAQRPPTSTRTFGYRRVEILAALANGAALAVVSVLIGVEAIARFSQPQTVHGLPMLGVAAGGLLINIIGLIILHGGSETSLNVRGAYLHVMTDALGSVGAIISGFAIWRFGAHWVDPAASLLISALVLYSAWVLLRETLNVLMEAVPPHIDLDEVRAAMAAVPGVHEVHDLHIWTITSGMESLSGHVVAPRDIAYTPLLNALRRTLHDQFGIEHITIQVEPPDFDEQGNC